MRRADVSGLSSSHRGVHSVLMRPIVFLVLSMAAVCSVLAADPPSAPKSGDSLPLVVDLWPGTAPDETGDIGPERIRMSPKLDRKQVEVTEQTKLITAVTKPTISAKRICSR